MIHSRQSMEKKALSLNRKIILILTMMICTFLSPQLLAAQPVISNDAIENAVLDELMFDPAVPVYRIDVTCTDGIVTLDGTVTNLLAKERALRITETVRGVRSVINRIQVSVITPKEDGYLRKEIFQALTENPATELYKINLSVDSGHITVRGRLGSIREKKLVETVIKSISGVKSIENNIDLITTDDRSDKNIRSEITQGLRWNALVDHEFIKVKVKNGTVWLSGVVGSAAEKRQAVISTWVSGVQHVDTSDLDIRYWAKDPMRKKEKYTAKSDAELKEAVIAALEMDPRVAEADLSVSVFDGIVTLKGRVDNLQSRRAAVQDARNTAGVGIVKNHLKVKLPLVTINDVKLEQKIENAFNRDAYVNSYEISVDVNNGVADLFGRVDTYFEKVRAEDVASIIRGIYSVNNNIMVQKGWFPYYYNPFVDVNHHKDYDWYSFKNRDKKKSDWEIRRSIQNELWWSPFVDADQVTVEVDDGKATLTGTVDSMMEVEAATENALEGGAISVDNDLVISSLMPPKKNN